MAVLLGATGLDASERHINADHLVIALGSVTNFHHVPGVEENALQMKPRQRNSRVRSRFGLLERARKAKEFMRLAGRS